VLPFCSFLLPHHHHILHLFVAARWIRACAGFLATSYLTSLRTSIPGHFVCINRTAWGSLGPDSHPVRFFSPVILRGPSSLRAMLSSILVLCLAIYAAYTFPIHTEQDTGRLSFVYGGPERCSNMNSSCPKNVNGIPTPMGNAYGIQSSPGVMRFVVQYATSSRWQEAIPATTWTMPYVSLRSPSYPLLH
jgi:hypothetical protein